MMIARPAALALLCLLGSTALAAEKLTPDQALKLLRDYDDTLRAGADLTRDGFVEETQGNQKVTREAKIYDRQSEDKMVVLITNPKSEQGSGYLRLERNLWSYDARVGKWERRTERDRISGTNLRRSDFANLTLADQYTASDEGMEQLGKVTARKLTLKARDGADVAFPMIVLWLDNDLRAVKRQEYALSGKLLRTTYLVKSQKVFSKARNRDITLPQEIRMFDEVEKDRTTTMVFQSASLEPIAEGVFTKAWFESKSR